MSFGIEQDQDQNFEGNVQYMPSYSSQSVAGHQMGFSAPSAASDQTIYEKTRDATLALIYSAPFASGTLTTIGDVLYKWIMTLEYKHKHARLRGIFGKTYNLKHWQHFLLDYGVNVASMYAADLLYYSPVKAYGEKGVMQYAMEKIGASATIGDGLLSSLNAGLINTFSHFLYEGFIPKKSEGYEKGKRRVDFRGMFKDFLLATGSHLSAEWIKSMIKQYVIDKLYKST